MVDFPLKLLLVVGEELSTKRALRAVGLRRGLMDGAYISAVIDQAEEISAAGLFEVSRRDPPDHGEMTLSRLDDLGALVVTKTRPGFSDSAIAWLRDLIAQAADGRLGVLKFLVFDFAHLGAGPAEGGADFDALLSEAADLILQAPIVTIAHGRALMAGADLELALACSVMLAEKRTRFSFAGELEPRIATYGLLSQKIGFVRAERLMEDGEVLDAQQMHDLLLIKAIIPDGRGAEGARDYLQPAARRHNSAYGIYRARRLATPGLKVDKRPAA